MEASVDAESKESWDRTIVRFSDASVYQTWAYGAVRWGVSSLSHLVLRREGEVTAAAQLRIVRIPILPAGIAYLRWGPMCQRRGNSVDPMVVAAMMTALKDEYCGRRRLSLQVIPFAFNGEPRAAAYRDAFTSCGMKEHPLLGAYRTILVDLTPEVSAIRQQLDQKWRNQLNRAEKNGLILEVSDTPETYNEFVRIYELMRTRKQFKTTVDVREFARIQEGLSLGQKLQLFIARKDGEPVAGLLCSVLGEIAIYILGATNERARELKAAYYLHWQAMLWMKDRGTRAYDLGGVDPETNPGGHHFKTGFGGRDCALIPASVSSGGLLSAVLSIAATRALKRKCT